MHKGMVTGCVLGIYEVTCPAVPRPVLPHAGLREACVDAFVSRVAVGCSHLVCGWEHITVHKVQQITCGGFVRFG
eukprot:1237216-Amphidinium_carterae.1